MPDGGLGGTCNITVVKDTDFHLSLLDKLQQFAGWTETLGGMTEAMSNHRSTANIPQGGSFLFEDGHVEWLKFMYGLFPGAAASDSKSEVGAGSKYFEYLKPTDLDKGPW